MLQHACLLVILSLSFPSSVCVFFPVSGPVSVCQGVPGGADCMRLKPGICEKGARNEINKRVLIKKCVRRETEREWSACFACRERI